MSSPKFCVHVIGLNRIELTQACINSISRNTDISSYALILTNNASTDGTKEYFDSIAGTGMTTVVHNASNEGFIAPNNRAFEAAKQMGATYFIALNNDVEVPDGWLDKLAAPLDADLLGALSGPSDTCRTLHPNMDGYNGAALDYIEGSCLCVKIAVVSTQGPLFSTYLDFIYGDDSDLSLRMREAGYHIYQVPFSIKHSRCSTTHDPAVKARCEQARQRNHQVGMRRWSHYLKHRHFTYPLIVKRGYAIGDVLLTTPLVAALKSAKPEREIWVETDFPEIFQNNPDVARAGNNIGVDDAYPVVDLNGAYENTTQRHILDAYETVVRTKFPKEELPNCEVFPCYPKLYPSAADILWAKNLAGSNRFSPKICIMHADHGDWPGKNWPIDRFAAASWLVSLGWHVVAVGQRGLPHKFDAFNLINKTSILQLAALMKQSQLFIGGDSFPLHCALAMSCPAVGIFGVTQSKYIVHGTGPQIHLDAPDSIPCAGSRHRTQGSERVECSSDCINSHSVDDVKEAAGKLGVL